ncbi:hypothetical protein BC829DRAFT_381086 [Chytridium lagenaria]|nr:hypothetical protein BC829DRAFT_381086 [Chytridium lagenaria]
MIFPSNRPAEQIIMGAVFGTMGLATMLLPNFVSRLSFPARYLALQSPQEPNRPVLSKPMKLAIQCFGAQATLCGLLILTTRFTRETFRNFGVAMMPFFVFDYLAWKDGALTDFGALGDGIGNVVFTVCCYIGYSRLS